MPGGNGWAWSKSSCITKSTCSKTTVPFTSVFSTPETSVSTCVTSYPFTHTGVATSVYTTTEPSAEVGSSTKTVYSTVTKSSVWSTYTEVSIPLCPLSNDNSMITCLHLSVTFSHECDRSAPSSQLSVQAPIPRPCPWSLQTPSPLPSM